MMPQRTARMLDGRGCSSPRACRMPECAGRELGEIAAEWGCRGERGGPTDAARHGAIYLLMDENDVRRILAFDDTMIGSDGIPVDAIPHPRLWGTFPRVLGHYSREVRLFPLEAAIRQ